MSAITNRHNIRQHPVPVRRRNRSPLPCLQQHRQLQQLASTAQAFFELRDAKKLGLTRINFCFTRGQHFAMPSSWEVYRAVDRTGGYIPELSVFTDVSPEESCARPPLTQVTPSSVER